MRSRKRCSASGSGMGARPEQDRSAGPDATVGAIHVAPAHGASKPPRGCGVFGAREPDLSATSPQLITPALVAAVRPPDMLHLIRIQSSPRLGPGSGYSRSGTSL